MSNGEGVMTMNESCGELTCHGKGSTEAPVPTFSITSAASDSTILPLLLLLADLKALASTVNCCQLRAPAAAVQPVMSSSKLCLLSCHVRQMQALDLLLLLLL